MNTLTERQIGYLAGIIDGEGSISIVRREPKRGTTQFNLRVVVSQSDEEFLNRLQAMTGLGAVHMRKTLRNHQGIREAKRSGIWTVADAEARKLLECVIDALIIKRDRAQIAIALAKRKALHGGRRRTDDDEIKAREALRQSMVAANRYPGQQVKGRPKLKRPNEL
jgi:hypothetical protein